MANDNRNKNQKSQGQKIVIAERDNIAAVLENGKVTAEIGKAIILANLLGIDVEMNERL